MKSEKGEKGKPVRRPGGRHARLSKPTNIGGISPNSASGFSIQSNEGALADEAIRRRILIDQSRDGIVVLDESGKVYEANKRFAEMLGYSPKEARELHVWDWEFQFPREQVQEMVRSVDEKGDHFETRHRRKDGTTYDVEISTNGAVIAGHKLIFCVCRDITERKQTEEKMQHLTLVLRAIRNVNQLIARGVDRDSLFKGACENFVSTRGYYNAWIALLDESGKLVTAAEAGVGKKFRQMVERLKGGELPHCGREVLKKSSVVIIEDPASECIDCTLMQDYSGRCGMSVRLEYSGKVYGLMTVSAPPGVVGEKEEMDLFDEVAGDISFALYSMEQQEERRKAEKALADEAIWRRILIDQSRDGIVVLDENGKVYEVNQRFADMLGYSIEEARELSVWDWEFQFPREQVQEMVRSVDEKGDHFETRHRRKDGTTYDVEISTNGAMFAGHKLIFCVCRDITERKQAEEALRRTEQNFRDSLENSPLGIRIIDIVGKTLYANRPLLDMWGYNSIEELEAVPRKQRYTPQSYTEHMERAGKGRGGNVPLDYEVSIVRSDGQVRHLAAYTRALLWNGERQFQVVYQDVTERKKVEQELQDERMKLKEAQAIGKMGNWEYDADSQKIIWSDEVYVLYERDPALGPPTAEEEAKYYSTEQAKKLRDYAARAIKSGEEFKYDIEANLPSGRRAFFAASMRSIKNESGRVIRLFGTVQDITERKRQEEERRQLEQKAQLTSRLASVGEMAAGIAHEINNPLTSVIGYSQLLSGRKDITEDVKADLKAIDEGAQRVAGIIKRLLTFARQSKPERAFVNINDLITNTLDLRAYHLRTNNIKVTTKLATDLPLTTADPAQLQQVFLNIIVNAETAMTQANGRGKLLVKTEEVNGTIRISFKDNGSGIAKKNLERIFDPFFTTREVDQGTGLGLSICHGIIAEHKGKIWAESTLGRGATFMVELPIVTGSIQLEMAEPSGKKPKKMPKARILVVDDEPSTLEFLSRLLADEGHDVETVNNADEALEMVKNRRYSLILLDIKMPGTSGIELYGRMQKIALSLSERVIFITGDVMGTDTESFLSRTKAPFITKPFDVRQLKKKIERFLTGD